MGEVLFSGKQSKDSLLGKVKDLFGQEGVISEIANEAVNRWREKFSWDEFHQKLAEYEAMDEILVENPTPEAMALYRYFKEVRKAGQYLKTAYLTFDVTHDTPPKYEDFVRALGKLNDHFWHVGKKDSSLEYVQEMRKVLNNPEEWDDFGIQPDSSEHVLNSISNPYQRVLQLSEEAQSRPLTAPEFHKLRRKLRVFANIYTLAVSAGKKGDVKDFKEVLVDLNDMLGIIQDGLEYKSIAGTIDYEKEKIKIPEKLQKKIYKVLQG